MATPIQRTHHHIEHAACHQPVPSLDSLRARLFDLRKHGRLSGCVVADCALCAECERLEKELRARHRVTHIVVNDRN
jgi:hypothetical protein